MSTAGKVLIVVILLGVVGWIYLAANVAELNRNWQTRVNQTTAETERLREEAAGARVAFAQARNETVLVQEARDRDVTRLRGLVSSSQRTDSLTRETLDRYTLQLASVEAQVESARAIQQLRERESVETRRELVDTRAELDRIAAGNDELLGQLTTLREDLAATLQENRALVDQIRRGADAANGPSATRPASAR